MVLSIESYYICLPNVDLEPLETHFQYNLLDTFVALFPSLVGAIVIGLSTGNTANPSFPFSHQLTQRNIQRHRFIPHIDMVFLEFVKLSTNLPPHTGLLLFSGPWRPAILRIIVVLAPKIIMAYLSIPNIKQGSKNTSTAKFIKFQFGQT